jgi:hypothetical protein
MKKVKANYEHNARKGEIRKLYGIPFECDGKDFIASVDDDIAKILCGGNQCELIKAKAKAKKAD